MKARTYLIAIGAALALVVVAVEPAGAKVASSCSISHKQSAVVGYTGSGWSYPGLTARGLATASAKSCGAATKAAAKASTKKVLDVGNGTKVPHLVTVPKVKVVVNRKASSQSVAATTIGTDAAQQGQALAAAAAAAASTAATGGQATAGDSGSVASQPSTDPCSLTIASEDSGYAVDGLQGCDDSAATPASTDDGSTASTDDGSSTVTPVDGSYDDTDG